MLPKNIQEIDLENGDLLLVDKPLRWTSFDVVNKLKYEIRKNGADKKFKIGHAGTLDPLATGLLLVCVGKFTKKITEFQELEKKYTGTFILGATTQSYDLEKPIENPKPYNHITLDDLTKAAAQLSGTFLQTPPIFSAVKIKGKSAFEYARSGKEVEIKPKEITVSNFEITRFSLPEIDFSITCSKGTYIRSMARDLGEILGCGAYLSELRRTKIGDFSVEDAMDLSAVLVTDKKKDLNRKKKDFEI